MTNELRAERRGGGWRIAGWGAAAGLLALPFIAMRMGSQEVNWDGADFVFAAVLLGSLGLAIELLFRVSGGWAYRLGGLALAGTAFLIVWGNLAVGFLGNEDEPINLLYFGVVALVIAGAAISRLRPAGLAKVAVAAAMGHVAIIAVALGTGWGYEGALRPVEIVFSTLVFGGAWLFAAAMFRRAARDASQR